MANSWKRKVLFLIPLMLLIVAISALAVKRVTDHGQEKNSLKKRKTAPLPVHCIRTVTGPIQALVFGEGTARAVRREFLTFENQGKATYVKLMEDGQTIREGARVRGLKKGDKLGELLASLD